MKTLSSLILALSALSATPSLAQSPTAESRIVVRTADLDLSGASGQRALDHRIAIAVIEACGETSNVDPAGKNAIRACRVATSASVAANRDRLVELASRGEDIVLAAR
ncbi:MAG TPA: UrcA family protein [Sphingomicrobium sp.]|nr:UrcA family protein [Sphingomicrobium sp.]